MKKLLCVICLFICLSACQANKYFTINKNDVSNASIVQTHPPFVERELSEKEVSDVVNFLNNLSLEEIENPNADGDIDIIYLYTNDKAYYIAKYDDYLTINDKSFKVNDYSIKYIFDKFDSENTNEFVSPKLMEILDIDDESKLEDASKLTKIEVISDKAILNIYDVVSYKHFLMLLGTFKDKDGNTLTITDYDFNINGNSKSKIGGDDRSFIKEYDDYFVFYSYCNQYDLDCRDESDLNIKFVSNDISIKTDVTLDKFGKSYITELDYSGYVDVGPLFIHIQSNSNKFGTESITVYDKDGNVLDIPGTSLKKEGDSGWYTLVFDKYFDISKIDSISINTQYYSIDYNTGKLKEK